MDQRISKLDDRAVLRVLSAVTENLREELAAKETRVIGSVDDARLAIAAFIESKAGQKIDARAIAFEGPQAAQVARELLETLWEDPQVRSAVEVELANPPSDSQKSPELALAGAVILGALISWLQTMIEIEGSRKDGKFDFSFKLKKRASGDKIVSAAARTVSRLIGV
jgi:hypothetical protein